MATSTACPPRRETQIGNPRPAWWIRVDVIEHARVLSGRTREQLAVDAHLDAKTVRDRLNERRRPTVATIHCVLRALDLNPRDVIVFADNA